MISGDKPCVSVIISAMSMHYLVPLIESLDMKGKKSVTPSKSRGVASLFVDHFSTLSSLLNILQALRGSVCIIDYSDSHTPSNKDRSIGTY
jgi:hypothetical protein